MIVLETLATTPPELSLEEPALIVYSPPLKYYFQIVNRVKENVKTSYTIRHVAVVIACFELINTAPHI